LKKAALVIMVLVVAVFCSCRLGRTYVAVM
jgi:hypothetical protein